MQLLRALRYRIWRLLHPRTARWVDQQVAEDTCSAHNVFCCSECFDTGALGIFALEPGIDC